MTDLAGTFKAIAPYAQAAATVAGSYLTYAAAGKSGSSRGQAAPEETEEDTGIPTPTDDQIKDAELRRRQASRRTATGRRSTILTGNNSTKSDRLG